MTTYILSPSEYVEELYVLVSGFLGKMKMEPLERKDCFDIVLAMIDDCVGRRFCWTKTPETMDDVIRKYLPWYYTKDMEELSDEFYAEAIDPLFIKVAALVGEVIPERTWNIWYQRRIGRDIALEEGIDYRVFDWERRMESGEWSMDDD